MSASSNDLLNRGLGHGKDSRATYDEAYREERPGVAKVSRAFFHPVNGRSCHSVMQCADQFPPTQHRY